MFNVVKFFRTIMEWKDRKRHRRYGTLLFFSASRKIRCYKRRDPVFELSGCCLKRCRFPMLTCDKCHMEY